MHELLNHTQSKKENDTSAHEYAWGRNHVCDFALAGGACGFKLLGQAPFSRFANLYTAVKQDRSCVDRYILFIRKRELLHVN